MNRWKRNLKKFMNPPFRILCVVSVVIAVALLVIFGMNIRHGAISYFVYILSAYLFALWLLRFVRAVQNGKKRLMRYRLLNRYMTDMNFKAEVSLYFSLGINLMYSVYEAASGIIYHSVWFGTVAFYYMVLSVERFSLLNYMRKQTKNKIGIYKRYRFCGILLIALNIAVSGMTILVICTGESPTYPGHMIYAVAGYSFYNLISAIVNVVTYHKKTNPIYAASKILSLSTALFSMFSLQNAMIPAFGHSAVFQRNMNAITGFVVFALLALLSVYMILQGNRMIHRELARPSEPAGGQDERRVPRRR